MIAIANYLTTSETAARLGVSPARVRQFVMAGRLAPKKIGQQLFFESSEIAKFRRIQRKSGRPKILSK